jgi:hypothetical protein
MVTKQEVMDYYAQNRKDSNNGMCPHFVEIRLKAAPVDKDGDLYKISSYFDEGDSTTKLTLDEVKNDIRAEIRQTVVDLIKISEI